MGATQPKKKLSGFGWMIGLVIKSTKLLKSLKLLKILITPLSMLLSVLVYGWAMGFWFGFGFVLLLFVHEMGHVIAMKIKGYPTKMPVFIPMLGAVIFAPGFKNREEEAFIGYGGPFLGGIGALALFGIWAILPQKYDLLLTLSYVGLFLNLFNMIPISPMDGGRVTKIIGTWFVWIGVAMLAALIILTRSPFILLIGILALGDMNMNPRRTLRWAIGLEVAMIMMIALRISSQDLVMDLFDIFLATLFVALLAHAARVAQKRGDALQKYKERLAAINKRPATLGKATIANDAVEPVPAVATEKSAPVGVRIKWLALYLGLTALFMAGIAVQMTHLPAHLK